MSTTLYERGNVLLRRTGLGRGKGTAVVLTAARSSVEITKPVDAILLGIALLEWAAQELMRRYGDA